MSTGMVLKLVNFVALPQTCQLLDNEGLSPSSEVNFSSALIIYFNSRIICNLV